ncbi:MAG TPA: gamma-glutamyltransferase, partial [Gemmatimonadaceae bacterium]|nr:gamma-glutamyltransferase [Gemmatimonadaceae bacterium]
LSRALFPLCALAACQQQTPGPGAPSASAWRLEARPVRTERAIVSSNSELATAAGVEILRRGGNAVDAAVAVAFALAVAYPEAGNIGGGGFMLARFADGRTAALDFREVAPLGATRTMYADSASRAEKRSLVGHLAVGVPGSVAGLTAALDSLGTLPLRDVMQPAIRLATEGFTVDSALARSLTADSALISRFAGASVFLPGGVPVREGQRLLQPELARTLERIAERGPKGFYEGETADLLVAEMRRGGGLITHEDLARYRPVWRRPLEGTYRGYALLGMPPSSSGGITLIETLNILETRSRVPPFGSVAWTHLVAEAFRRAFIDRNTRLGDPAFVRVPVDTLTSKAYARELAESIANDRATPSPSRPTAGREGNETTHFSVVDQHGNAVALTTTINELYGSGAFVHGAGFFLNDEMDDFTARPGEPNTFGLVQGEANAIEPGKRMLSAMTPTIVLDREGELLLVLGSRGGPRIITSVAQTILNVLDHGMNLGDAVAAPRIHHQAWPDSLRYEPNGLAGAVVDSLRAMGHAIGVAPWGKEGFSGRIHAVMRVPGGYVGVVDPRTSGGVAGL